jgi:hypothetical protein
MTMEEQEQGEQMRRGHDERSMAVVGLWAAICILRFYYLAMSCGSDSRWRIINSSTYQPNHKKIN